MRPLRALLEEVLAEVARSCPAAMDAITSRCAGVRLGLASDGERFTLSVEGAGPGVRDGMDATDVRVGVSRRALRDLILGDAAVIDAVRDGRLTLQGAPRDLATAETLARLLVAGAARAPGTAGILDEFLDGVRETP